MDTDLMILMTNVDGIYDKPPSKEDSKMMDTISPEKLNILEFGAISNVGTGGMESKTKAAFYALSRGTNVVICNGMESKTKAAFYALSRGTGGMESKTKAAFYALS